MPSLLPSPPPRSRCGPSYLLPPKMSPRHSPSDGHRGRAGYRHAARVHPVCGAVHVSPRRLLCEAARRGGSAAAQALGGGAHAPTHGAAVGLGWYCALLTAPRPLERRPPVVDDCRGFVGVAVHRRGHRLLGVMRVGATLAERWATCSPCEAYVSAAIATLSRSLPLRERAVVQSW